MKHVECGCCGKEYKKNEQVATKSEPICYDCALKSLIGKSFPEEGDFNSARLMSGEISGEEMRILQADLEAVDYASRACGDCGQVHCRCDYYDDRDDRDNGES